MLRLSSTGTDSYQSQGARVSGLRPSEKLAFSLALERAGLENVACDILSLPTGFRRSTTTCLSPQVAHAGATG